MTEQNQRWPQYLAAVTSSILAIGCGLHFGWPSPAIPRLLQKELQFELTAEEISYVVMIGPLGYLVSSPFCAFIVDKIGRKQSLLLLALPQIVAWFLVANANSLLMLYAARLVAGAAEGGVFTILPTYICEISEPRIRGTLGTIASIALILGIFLINCYGSFTSIKYAAYASISVPLLFIMAFVCMPESPYFLLMKGRIEDARASLKRLRKMKNVEDELSSLALDVERQISESGSFKEIFTIASNLRAFIILLGLRSFQQLSGYSAFSFYAQVIFERAGGHLSAAEYAIIYNGSHLIFIGVGSILLDRFGRRPLLLCSTIGISIVLFLGGLYFYLQHSAYDVSKFLWLPITTLLLYTVMFDIGLGVVPNVLTGEIFSASIKGKALGVLILYCALAISVSSKLFQWLKSSFGMHVPFFVFSCCCIVAAIFCYCCIPETQGKSLEEIQQTLRVTTNIT